MRNSFLTTITDIILITSAFIIFVQTVLLLNETIFLKKKLLERIFENTNLSPIGEIDLDKISCDKENGFEPLFNYTFSGVSSGSYSKISNDFHDDFCHDNSTNCINIPGIRKQYLNIWLDRVLCLKRLKNIAWRLTSNDSECEENYKQCGVFGKFNDKLCVDNSTICPINYLSIKSINEINLNDTNFNYLQLNPTTYIVTSSKLVSNQIPIDFKVSEAQPCLEKERTSYNQKYAVYPRMNDFNLLNCTRSGSDKNLSEFYYDHRYKNFSSNSKKKFLFENDLNNKYKKLPEVGGWVNDAENDNQNKLYLYQRSYITPNISCLGTDFSQFSYFTSKLTELKLINYFQMCLSLANIFLLCFFVSLLSLVKIIKRLLHTIITFIKILLCGGFITYSFLQYYRSNEITNHVIDWFIKIDECSDNYIRDSMKLYGMKESINSLKGINEFVFWFSVLYSSCLLLQFIRLIHKFYIRIKNRNRRKIARSQLGRDLIGSKADSYKTEALGCNLDSSKSEEIKFNKNEIINDLNKLKKPLIVNPK